MKHKLAVAVSLILVCLSVMGLFFFLRTPRFMETAANELAAKASSFLAAKIEIGSIRPESFHSVAADDIAVYDKEGNSLLQADSLRLDFSIVSLLQGGFISAIDDIYLSGVSAELAERDDGSWNYEDFTEDMEIQDSSFKGTVHVQEAELTVSLGDKTVYLSDVKGKADFSSPETLVQAEFGLYGSSHKVKGNISRAHQKLHLESENIDVADYLELLPREKLPDYLSQPSGHISRLSMDADRQGDELSLQGQAAFNSGSISVLDTSVSDIAGVAFFTERGSTVFAAAKVAGQEVSLDGKIDWHGSEPSFNLGLTAKEFDPSLVLAHCPLQGKTAFSALVWGTPSAPCMDGEFSVKEGSLYGMGFTEARVRLHYEDEIVSADSLQVKLGDGKVNASGSFAADTQDYEGWLKADKVSIDGLVQDRLPMTGMVSADIGFSGHGLDSLPESVYGSAALSSGSYKDIVIKRLAASFAKSGEAITLDYISASFANGGELGCTGQINLPDEMALSFYGTDIDLSVLQGFLPQADMSGRIGIQGSVSGPMGNPLVQVDFAAVDGELFQQPYTTLQGSASGSLDGVGIDYFSLKNDGKETWQVHGSIGFTGEKRLNLRVDTLGARMEDIAALIAPDQPITGNVDNVITLTGSLDNPEAVGYIHFYRGSYHGILISGMDGDYKVHDGITTLHDFHIYAPLVNMDLNGTIDGAHNLDMVVAAHDVDVNRVGGRLPYPISGHGVFAGKISGTLSAPLFAGQLQSEEMVFNGQVIKNAHGNIRYGGHTVRFEHFGFWQNEGEYSLTALADLNTSALDGDITVKHGDINALLAMFNLKNDMIAGRLDGNISLAGQTNAPQVHFTGQVSEGSIAGYAVNNVQMDMGVADKAIYINGFSGYQGQGSFAAQGVIDPQAGIDLDVSAKDIDSGMVAKLAGMQKDAIGGTFSFAGHARGEVSDPEAELSIEAKGQESAAIGANSLSGLLNLRHGIVNVEQVILKRTYGEHNYKATLYGTVPLRALGYDIGQGEQIDLRLSLDKADLSILQMLSPDVDWAIGETDGTLALSGTLAQPLFYGNFGIQDGAVKLKELAKPLTNMKLKLVFAGDHINLSECSGQLGEGSYTAQGITWLDGFKPTKYDVSLDFNKLDIDCNFYRGPLTGNLRLFETTAREHVLPGLSGNIMVQDALVSIPALPENSTELPMILLDVDLQLGDKVRFYSPVLYDMQLGGAAHFGGFSVWPNTSGSIFVKKGTVSYLKTVFKIREGEASFGQPGSFLPFVTLKADTLLNRTRVFLQLSGPANQMELQLQSNPPLNDTEIIRLLTFRSDYQTGRMDKDEFMSVLDLGAQMAFLSGFEDAMRDVLQIDEFRVERDTLTSKKIADNSSLEVYNIKLGEYISDKVMLRYTQSVGANNYRYGLEYNFNNSVGLTMDCDQDGAYIAGIEARIRF